MACEPDGNRGPASVVQLPLLVPQAAAPRAAARGVSKLTATMTATSFLVARTYAAGVLIALPTGSPGTERVL